VTVPGAAPSPLTERPLPPELETFRQRVRECVRQVLGPGVAAAAVINVEDGGRAIKIWYQGEPLRADQVEAISPCIPPPAGLSPDQVLPCIGRILGPQVEARVTAGTVITGNQVQYGGLSSEEARAVAACFPGQSPPPSAPTSAPSLPNMQAAADQALTCIGAILGQEVEARVRSGTTREDGQLRLGVLSTTELSAVSACFQGQTVPAPP
jgi:hypothetical protein